MPTDVKIVRPPREPNGAHSVNLNFTEMDAWEWGRWAIRNNRWQATCEVGESRFRTDVETAVAIASPDGRVGVWYNRITLPRAMNGRGRTSRRDDTIHNLYTAAYAALCGPDADRRVDMRAIGAAKYWDKKLTRGGERDLSPLAMAALRLYHAEAFGDTPTLRDQLLAEFAVLKGDRPPTTHLLRANEDELLAASALLTMGDAESACRLLARKGVAA